jgi:hypothetical protein
LDRHHRFHWQAMMAGQALAGMSVSAASMISTEITPKSSR